MVLRITAIVDVVAVIALAVVLNVLSPSTATPLGILGVFALLYVICASTLLMILIGVSWLAGRFSWYRSEQSHRRRYYYATILGLAPIILLAIRSIGQLGLYDIVLVVLFEVISCIYITRQTA